MINWKELYYKHIKRCKNQTIEEGKIYHKHHILPKSSGGNDDESNLVILTYNQHVFAHFLLYKWKPTNSNWIAYRLMSGVNENKKQAIEELKILRVKESKNNKKWDPKIIEKRRESYKQTIQNMTEEEFYNRYVKNMEGPLHPMYGKKRPGELAGNYGKSKGTYTLYTPDREIIEFPNLKSLMKYGFPEGMVRKWVNKGIIQKDSKCYKPFKWEGYEVLFQENPDYGKINKQVINRKRKL